MSEVFVENFGDLKALLTSYMFHPRFEPLYRRATQMFERAANRRLRTLKQETVAYLTTSSAQALPGTTPPLEKGYAPVPYDYLAWRLVEWRGREPLVELDYVHPAYLRSTWIDTDNGDPKVFSIENRTFYAAPPDDGVAKFVLHYYKEIPTIVTADITNNWLLLDWPDAYLFGVLTELMALGRNREAAELYKARRDETFAEITRLSSFTTGATSKLVRTSEFF